MIETLTYLDLAALTALNGLAGNYSPVDALVSHVAENPALKGVPVMMLFWGLWFLPAPDRERRNKLTAVLLISIATLFVGRMLALALPFRLRPIHSETIDVKMPYGVSARTLDGWSSMPSDHAVMYFSIATGLFLVHRLAGSLTFLHALLVVSLPRIYLGVHFPSDILVGAVVGALTIFVLLPPVTRVMERLDILKCESRYAYLWYPALFFVTFQWATMFNTILGAVSVAKTIGVAILT